jgi:hypothetical protein
MNKPSITGDIRVTLGRHGTRTRIQMFQFWHHLADQMVDQVGRIVADRSLFRELRYRTLNGQDAVR